MTLQNTLKFWGVRGSYPTPDKAYLKVGGNTCCIEFNINGKCFIVDAGNGIIGLGKDILKRKNISHFYLLFTHYHWDHISGLPFFIPAYLPKYHFTILGPGKDENQVKERLSQQMKTPYFPIETESWQAKIDYLSPVTPKITCNNVTVTPFVVHHPGVTFGYKFCFDNKKIIFIPDNEFSFLDLKIDKEIAYSNDDVEKELMLSMKDEYKQQSIDIIKDADILIHDAQYTDEDYISKQGWGHSRYIDTINMAIDANVKCLYLFHFDPNYDDDKVEQIHQHCLEIIKQRKSKLICKLSIEGTTVEL